MIVVASIVSGLLEVHLRRHDGAIIGACLRFVAGGDLQMAVNEGAAGHGAPGVVGLQGIGGADFHQPRQQATEADRGSEPELYPPSMPEHHRVLPCQVATSRTSKRCKTDRIGLTKE